MVCSRDVASPSSPSHLFTRLRGNASKMGLLYGKLNRCYRVRLPADSDNPQQLLDCVQALFEGQVPPYVQPLHYINTTTNSPMHNLFSSYSDQLLLVGPTKFSEEHVERETERSRSDESKGWPYATPRSFSIPAVPSMKCGMC